MHHGGGGVIALLLLLLLQWVGANDPPRWLSPGSAYGDHAVVLPLDSGSYPLFALQVGSPSVTLVCEPRWDLSGNDGSLLLGYSGTAQVRARSRTLSDTQGTDLVLLGAMQQRLSVAFRDAPTPYSRCDYAACRAPRDSLLAVSPYAWLDLSNQSALWRHWHAWSLSNERLVLGAYRPIATRRARELHFERDDGPMQVELLSTTTTTNATTPLLLSLRFALDCDYSYVPSSVFSDLTAGNDGQAATPHGRRRVCFVRTEPHRVCFTLQHGAVRVHRTRSDELVLGRVDAQQFILGHDVLRGAYSVMLADDVPPPFSKLDYVLVFGILLALVALWLLGVFPAATRPQRAAAQLLVLPRVAVAHYRANMASERSLLGLDNMALLSALVLLTRLAVVGTLCMALVGFRIDRGISSDLPLNYTRALCALAMVLALRGASWPLPRASYAALGVYHYSNALLAVCWLMAALHARQFVAQLLMAGAASVLCWRTGEMFMHVLLEPLLAHRGLALLRARAQWLWIVDAALCCAIAAWLFCGFTVPLLLDEWWDTTLFKAPLIVAAALLVCVFRPLHTFYSRYFERADSALRLALEIGQTHIDDAAAANKAHH